MELTELNKQLNKHKNKIFNIAVVIAAVVIAFNFIYKKQLKEIESLKKKKDTEIKKLQVLDEISQLEGKINAYKNLLSKKDTSLVINTIGNIAKESGVKIVSIKPGPERRHPQYIIKFIFDLMISTANYHALGKFISKLESYPDVYMIETLDIRPLSQTKELTVNLKISTVQFTD